MMLDELKCPGCGKIIDQQGEAALFCPHCGTSLADKPGGKNGKKTRLIYLLAGLAAVILIIAAAIVMNGLTASRLNSRIDGISPQGAVSSSEVINWNDTFWCTAVQLNMYAGQTVNVAVSDLVTGSGVTSYYVILSDRDHYMINDANYRYWYVNTHQDGPCVTTITVPQNCDMVMVLYDAGTARLSAVGIDHARVTAWVDGSVPHYGTFSILGDSISTFKDYVPRGNLVASIYPPPEDSADAGDVRSVKDTWWWKFADQYGSAMQLNDSWSGSPICYDGWSAGTNDAKEFSFIGRLRRIPQSELILVFGGTNDAWLGAEQGEYTYSGWTEESLSQFRPAAAYMLDWLIHHHPGAKIVFIKNNLDPEYADYLESIDTVCAHYRIPVVAVNYTEKTDNHPTASSMSEIAVQLIDALVTMPGRQPADTGLT